MMKTCFTVLPEASGERADKLVAAVLPRFSRSFWQKQFELGHVRFKGAAIKNSFALSAGDMEITVPEPERRAIELPIIYEDDDVLVINKPAGILTHAKGALLDEATVADFVRPRTTDAPDSNRPGIVHRLDRDTSGVLIAAKNNGAKRWLQGQFSQRKTKKTYIALVEGELQPREAVLRLPLERNPKEPQKYRVGAAGKSAETEYTVIRDVPGATLVELRPHTGRTHQLRVHIAYLGHPIVGDRLYGHEEKSLHGRLFLHAAKLELTLPNRERLVFEAPLPAELQDFLQRREA